MISGLDQLAAGGAAIVSGGLNALAGGGTLISFPTLVAIGVPTVDANVTNSVSLVPGYLAGSWVQRDDLRPQLVHARLLSIAAGLGGLAGSILLVTIPSRDFRLAVPYLILSACLLLLLQDWIRKRVARPSGTQPSAGAKQPGADQPGAGAGSADGEQPDGEPPDGGRPSSMSSRPALGALVFLGGVYGGFFGGGLGIMLLAVLALFSTDPLAKVNALKQALSFLINLVAAVFFVFSGHVVWVVVPIMAVGSLVGGYFGSRLVPVIPERLLRWLVVAAGVAIAISFWIG